jgi:hypothetical protein
MKIIREGHATPDLLTKIDCKSNIIMCIHPNERDSIQELKNFPDKFQIKLSRDINLSTNDIISISSSALAATVRPNLKISFPVGITPVFDNFSTDHNQDIFWKIYKSCNYYSSYKEGEVLDHHIIDSIKFILYMDTIRMREAGLQMILRKDTPIIDFFFSYYIQTKKEMVQIEDVYLFIDENIYSNFVNIF